MNKMIENPFSDRVTDDGCGNDSIENNLQNTS
jgi:hypothetical protein